MKVHVHDDREAGSRQARMMLYKMLRAYFLIGSRQAEQEREQIGNVVGF